MMKALRWISLFLLIGSGCGAVRIVPEEELESMPAGEMVRFFYPSSQGRVEAYITRPRVPGKSPLVILLHGHSIRGRGAAQVLAAAEALTSELCFTSMAISLPGYGDTDVAPAPMTVATRRVVLDGLALAKKLHWVDSRRVYIYGVSRGAVVSAALVQDIENLGGVVLLSGAYDLERLYRESSSFWLRKLLNPEGEANPKFVNLITEPSRWRAPTLILHGAEDALIPAQQSVLLQKRLQAAGTVNRLIVYPERGHFLPLTVSKEATFHFLKELSGPTCGAS